MTDHKNNIVRLPATDKDGVGYKRPPAHSRFKPGQSGNPSGRAKGSQNFKTLFHKILKEQVSLREGADVRKVTKAEAIMRGMVVGALKGDSRSLGVLFRLAEQTGQFEDESNPISQSRRVIVGGKGPVGGDGTVFVDTGVPRAQDIPGSSETSKEASE
jgi:hypothetical protein